MRHALPLLRALALLMLLAAGLPLLAEARGYRFEGRCGGYERLPITSPVGTCVALVADEREGLRAPRRILEVAPGRYWLLDMGSWEPRQGRLLEMRLPAAGEAPYRAHFTTLAQGLDRPLGLARGPHNRIYIGEAGSIWRTRLPAAGKPLQRDTVIDGLPDDGTHPLKELAFAPNGKLYVNMGSGSDDCREGKAPAPLPCPQREGTRPRAAVYEAVLAPGSGALQSFHPFAVGLRNSVALTVLQSGPARGTVLQGENSIDYRQVDQPAEELNRLQRGRDYGWPYCVAMRQRAQAYPQADCSKTEAPLMLWPAHAAPLQMLVGPANTAFANQLLVAWRGPQATGHRVVGFRLDARGLPTGAPIDWLSGWHAEPGRRPLGRPSGITVDSAGRLLAVEDYNRTVLMLLPEASAPPVPSAPSSATPR